MIYVVFLEEDGKATAVTPRFDIEADDWADARAKAGGLFGVSQFSSSLFCVKKSDLGLREAPPPEPPKDPAS